MNGWTFSQNPRKREPPPRCWCFEPSQPLTGGISSGSKIIASVTINFRFWGVFFYALQFKNWSGVLLYDWIIDWIHHCRFKTGRSCGQYSFIAWTDIMACLQPVVALDNLYSMGLSWPHQIADLTSGQYSVHLAKYLRLSCALFYGEKKKKKKNTGNL